MTNTERLIDDRQYSHIEEKSPVLAALLPGCPSCSNNLRYGIQTQVGTGKINHVVWCHRPECGGCRGDGATLAIAISDLDKNFKRRKKNV